MNLFAFTTATRRLARNGLRNANADQRQMLERVLCAAEATAVGSDLAQPLSLLNLTARACGVELNERASLVGAACHLYVCSLDLFDDVQDDDLATKAHGITDPALATNNAIALLFLAFDALRAAAESHPIPDQRLAALRLLNETSLAAVSAQHVDLLGASGAATPAEVLSMHQGKTSSVSLFLELGAWLGNCSPELLSLYRSAGRNLAGIVQIIDDLRDVYGKDESPDLRDRKVTYPFACFREMATPEQLERFDDLSARLPASLPEIREFWHETGVVDRCVEAIDELRIAFHESIAATGNTSPHHRTLLTLVDALVEPVYTPDPLPCTAEFFRTEDAFSRELAAVRDDFLGDLRDLLVPELPPLCPWHLPHFEYDPERGKVFYPDADGLPDEVLPFHADLCGTRDLTEARETLRCELPFVLAHEMFHFLRHHHGRLSEDRWHEEHVANRLAVAYTRTHRPEALALSIAVAGALIARSETSPVVDEILRRAVQDSGEARGYDVDVETAALVHAQMVTGFAKEELDLDRELAKWLGIAACPAVAAE
jgi:geranylgeranyl pyrophosphate synthase